MSKEEFEGKWDQMHDSFQDWWSKLTDEDLSQVGGRYDRMIGMIQLRYGYKREQVKRQLNDRMATFQAHPDKGVDPRPN